MPRARAEINHLKNGFFHGEGGADKVHGAQPAEDGQDKVEGEIAHGKGLQRGGKRALPTQNEVAYEGGRYGTQKQRQDPAHGQVEKEDLQGEQHAGEGSVEDTRHGSGGAASEKERHAAVAHAGVAPEGGADGGARVHDGGLGTHGTAEPDGEGACHERAPAVMALDFGFVLGNGLEHLGDPVPDVVLDDVAYKEKAQEHTHAREHQMRQRRVRIGEGKLLLDPVDGKFEAHGGKAAQDARENRQHQKGRAFGNPTQKGPERAPDELYATTVCHGYYSSSLPLEYWAMLSSGRVSPAASEASALPPATASFSASSSPSSQRATSSRSSVLTLILTR